MTQELLNYCDCRTVVVLYHLFQHIYSKTGDRYITTLLCGAVGEQLQPSSMFIETPTLPAVVLYCCSSRPRVITKHGEGWTLRSRLTTFVGVGNGGKEVGCCTDSYYVV